MDTNETPKWILWLLSVFPRPMVAVIVAILIISGVAFVVAVVGSLLFAGIVAVWVIGAITGLGDRGTAAAVALIMFIGLVAAYIHSVLPRREKKQE